MVFLEKEISLGDRDVVGVNAPVLTSARGQACELGNGTPDGGCGNRGVEMFGSTLLCERHAKEVEARERNEHWEEVNVYLNMWTKVAYARGNETLLRLLRYARLEARGDRECERKALERAIETGR